MTQPKLLLTTAFKPYGVVSPYTREVAGAQMEFINNQVTREQGVHSPRESYMTWSLNLLAENISVPTVVLDFPSKKDFIKELRRGYSHVGISFIVPNIYKIQWMANYIRKHYPKTKIILGGHGTNIPDIEKIVPCDAICHGEGIRWLQSYFGEDTSVPILHPVLMSSTGAHLYGLNVSVHGTSLMLFPGVGCPYGCEFCATSHKFGKKYIAFLPTGKDMFNVCLRGEEQTGIHQLGIIDENFSSQPERAKEFLQQMEMHLKPYTFELVFSSGDAVSTLGVDFFIRLGVHLLYIGVESKEPCFKKTKCFDVHALINELQNNGISVLSSSVLFLDHHDKSSILSEIDWAINIKSDLHQFMQLHAWPGTTLWKRFTEEHRIREDLSWDMITGQGELANFHRHFNPEEARTIVRDAFRKQYETNGPGVLNMAHTAIRGYDKARKDFESRKKAGLVWNSETNSYEKSDNPKNDDFMQLRIEKMRERALKFRPLLLAAKLYSPNASSRQKADNVMRLYNEVVGPPTIKDLFQSFLFVVSGAIESIRIWIRKVLGLSELLRQPRTIRTQYRIGK